MSDTNKYPSLTGTVVFNHISQPDVYKGQSRYKITIALDDAGKKVAKSEGLITKEYNGAEQFTAKTNYERPLVYNSDHEVVDHTHLSLFGDKVTVNVQKGKGDGEGYAYLRKIRVDEKAEGAGEYDPADF